MMKSLIKLLILVLSCCHVLNQHHTTPTKNLIQTYANVSAEIATYFSSACIYFLTHSEEEDGLLLTMTAKYVSSVYGRSNAVATFSEYYKMLNTTPLMYRCYVPLQVIIDIDDDPAIKEDFSIHSHRTSMHGTDQYGGGVWLLFLKSFEPDFVEEYFRAIQLPFDVELIVAWIGPTEVHLKEAYRVVPAYPLRQPYLGNWTYKAGLHAPRDPLHYSRRTDLEGFKMTVGYVDYPPITMFENNSSKILSGYFGDIWKVLEDAMNATTMLEKYDEYGEYIVDTNAWTGLLGGVKHNKVDIGVADFILTRNRFEIMDFSFPLIVTTYNLFYQFPGSKMEASALFLPFGYDLWITLAVWIILGSVALYYACYITDAFLGAIEDFKFMKSFFFVFGALCAQSSYDMPKRISSRIIFLLTFMITSVLIPSYSASLISYLTVMPPVIPFTNMREFYLVGKYRMLVRKGSYEEDIFAYGSDPYVRKIYERDIKGKKDLPHSYKDAIGMLCKHKNTAFFAVDDTMQWLLDYAEHIEKSMGGCVITKMEKDVGSVTVGMALAKKSHFKGLVNHHIRNFQSIGIMERLRKKYWVEWDKLLGEIWSPVNIQNSFMIFSILAGGIILSCMMFGVEKIFILNKKPISSEILNNVPKSKTHLDKFKGEYLFTGAFHHKK